MGSARSRLPLNCQTLAPATYHSVSEGATTFRQAQSDGQLNLGTWAVKRTCTTDGRNVVCG
ncbi:hypothetical protein BJX65DRAFT_268126 [Aspergillus insuetus]